LDRRRIGVFVFLTAMLLAVATGYSLWRYRSQAPYRDAWNQVATELGEQKARIDSLSTVLAELEAGVDEEKVRLSELGVEITRLEREAVNGRLPRSEYRRYRGVITRHNEIVETHNASVAEMQRSYARYSTLVDTHNALIDSANRLQRTAVERGIQLPQIDSLR
jgi:septal ring factor EnvC (AmiA/AmiB activator)